MTIASIDRLSLPVTLPGEERSRAASAGPGGVLVSSDARGMVGKWFPRKTCSRNALQRLRAAPRWDAASWSSLARSAHCGRIVCGRDGGRAREIELICGRLSNCAKFMNRIKAYRLHTND